MPSTSRKTSRKRWIDCRSRFRKESFTRSPSIHDFVDESIHEVYKTLFEAGVLVLVVILLFLQDWRAVLIPATTVPVTIIGAFAAMKALGFTINMLTLFGLVLAIGIVVDDAIVIVENAVHHIDRGRMDPKSATIKACPRSSVR